MVSTQMLGHTLGRVNVWLAKRVVLQLYKIIFILTTVMSGFRVRGIDFG